jgi:FkbM family methyltransferase
VKPWLRFALAQAPGLYSWALRRRTAVNLEKLTFLALVRRGDVVLDIGANLGYYTLLFSHLVGRRGRVHAFEPVPTTFSLLAAAVARERRFANVALNACALSAANGELRLYVPGKDHGQAAIVRHRAGAWRDAPEVETHLCRAATLDGYLQARGEAPPAFVKCDTEGAELLVLEGAVETLRRRPPLLHLEINADWMRDLGYGPPDLVRFLAPFGYSRFLLVDDLAARRLAEPAAELADFAGSANLICAVPELHAARLRRLRLPDHPDRGDAGRAAAVSSTARGAAP